MKKYYKQSIEFKNFETNDYGTLFSDGSFTVNGRSDTTIISGGENFSKILIEDNINNIPDIIRSRVIGVEDEKWGQKIIAFIETENKFIDVNNILHLLELKIAKKMIPKHIYIVPCIDNINKQLTYHRSNFL